MRLFPLILAAYDGSLGSERALESAIALARDQDTHLVILSVVDGLPRFAATMDEMDETIRVESDALAERQRLARRKAEEQGIMELSASVLVGYAAQLIVDAAEREHAELLVLGRSGHSEVWGRFMGSTADKIARHAPCSVLIAH